MCERWVLVYRQSEDQCNSTLPPAPVSSRSPSHVSMSSFCHSIDDSVKCGYVPDGSSPEVLPCAFISKDRLTLYKHYKKKHGADFKAQSRLALVSKYGHFVIDVQAATLPESEEARGNELEDLPQFASTSVSAPEDGVDGDNGSSGSVATSARETSSETVSVLARSRLDRYPPPAQISGNANDTKMVLSLSAVCGVHPGRPPPPFLYGASDAKLRLVASWPRAPPPLAPDEDDPLSLP